jgi:hypothetical protein
MVTASQVRVADADVRAVVLNDEGVTSPGTGMDMVRDTEMNGK